VVGDLGEANLGVSAKQMAELKGEIAHFFHLGAIYDLKADAASQEVANIEGTKNAIALAEAVEAGCFHLASSIAAAGSYKGVFREDMFDEATGLEHPYFRTKHDSEGLVRKQCSVPWRVYRPAMVLGHSKTGEMDKVDGPYYFFKLLQKLRNNLPQWMPLLGIQGGQLNMVPVDYVVDAMDHIAHTDGNDGRCFHLVDPNALRLGEALNTFADAGHAPRMMMPSDYRDDFVVTNTTDRS
jgi:thioester reductase-like protein